MKTHSITVSTYMFCAALSLGGWAASGPSPTAAGEAGKDEGGAGVEPRKEVKPAAPATEREKEVLALFTASEKRFNEGKLVLVYDFSTESEDLVNDWRPGLAETRKRVRWAYPGEGTWSTIERGIVIADRGEWVHKAVFLPDLEVKVDLINVAPQQKSAGTVFGPTFYSEKKKKAIGVTGGTNFFAATGGAVATSPFPRPVKELPPSRAQSVGYRYQGKAFDSYLNGKKVLEAPAPFVQGYESGHVGFEWNGSVQCFIKKVVMEGRLDPEWVSAQLDKGGKAGAEKKSEKSPEKGASKKGR